MAYGFQPNFKLCIQCSGVLDKLMGKNLKRIERLIGQGLHVSCQFLN